MSNFLYSEFVETLASALLHSLWQAGLIYLLLKFVGAYGSKLNSHYRYVLAIGAIFLFFLVNATTFGLLHYERYYSGPEYLTGWGNLAITMNPGRVAGISSEGFDFSNYAPYMIMFWWLGIVLVDRVLLAHRIKRLGPRRLDRIAP